MELTIELPYDLESQLLEKVQQKSFSTNFWTKLHNLNKKRQKATLTELELQELITMTDIMEAANVEFIKALIELANIRQTDLDTLINQLGLKNDKHIKENPSSRRISNNNS